MSPDDVRASEQYAERAAIEMCDGPVIRIESGLRAAWRAGYMHLTETVSYWKAAHAEARSELARYQQRCRVLEARLDEIRKTCR